MSEELDTNLSEEGKFEQWVKEQKFSDTLEKAAIFAEETKEQFTEKIQILSGNIENVTSKVENIETKLNTVDDRLNTVDKSVGILCTGIDSVKEDIKKFQVSQDSLEKLVQEKIPVLSGNMESVTSEVKDVETKLSTVDDRLGIVDKSVGILCTGIDSVKEDIKKFQVSQDSLEKLVQEKIPVLSGNIENVTSKVENIETKLGIVDDRLRLSTVDDRLNTLDKSVGTLRTGIDSVKEDIKKVQASQSSLEKLVQEKIPILSGNIENVTSKVKGVETKLSAVDDKLGVVDDKLDTVDKSIGIFCTGIDCIIEDVKKVQVSQSSLEKLVQEKIPVLSGNIENVTSEVKDIGTKLGTIDDRLGIVDKSVGILCTGIDCANEDIKKVQVSQSSLEKLVQENIFALSGNIENVTSKVKDVETKLSTVDDKLGIVDKSVGILCTGIDCVNEDIKKFQVSQESLEKLVQERFKELGEKVQSLEHPTFTCENCGEQVVVPLSSYCPNCGSQIQSWTDENGKQAEGWIPYWKR
jgi:chromosome segregation ATPase